MMTREQRRAAFGVPLEIGGVWYRVYYDMTAHRQCIDEHGKVFRELMDERLAEGVEDVDALCSLLSIGIHGDLAAEEILEMTPPYTPSVEALYRARNRFYVGSEEVPGVDPTRNFLVRILMWIRRLMPRR